MLKDTVKFLLATLSGTFYIAILPHSVKFIPHLPWMVWFAFIPLIIAVRMSERPREAFLLGYLAGVIAHSALLSWLLSFGPAPLVLISLFYSLSTGLLGLVTYYIMEQLAPARWWWVFSACGVAILFIEGVGLWGFPWVYPVYALSTMPVFIQAADIGGIWLVSFLIFAVNIAVYQLLFYPGGRTIRIRVAIIVLALFFINILYGVFKVIIVPHGTPMSAVLVQGGLESGVEWTEMYSIIARNTYVRATERAIAGNPVDLVIWPESALGDLLDINENRSVPLSVRMLPRRSGIPLLMGVITRDGSSFRNSAILLDKMGKIAGVSDKCVPIAFGEALPFRRLVQFLPFPWGAVDIDRGRSLNIISVELEGSDGSESNSAKIATAICFDSIKPFVLREQVRRGANIIVIITNNSWYRGASGTEQHRMMDVFRAVENRRWTLRSSTTGISHVVDPQGRVISETSQYSFALLYTRAELLGGKALYTRLGDWFGWVCTIGFIIAFAWMLGLGRSADFE